MTELKEWQIKKENGVFDKRNRINDLTGKEWLFSTRSVKTKKFLFYFDIKELLNHNFIDFLPIELFSELILTFTKSNTGIIDPISNFGSIGYAAGNLDITRKFFGFKFNENIKIKFFKEFDLKNITFFTSTLANNIDRLSKENSYVLMSELIFSSLESEERNFSFQKFAKEVSDSIELLLEHNFIVNYVIIGIQNTKHSCNYNYNTKKILDLINSFDFNLKSELIWKIYDEDFFNIKSILLSKITNKSNIERLLNDKRILIFKRD